MGLYGKCIRCDASASQAVIYKRGMFRVASDRGGEDRMSVALGDIVFCGDCAVAFADEANARAVNTATACEICPGPAEFSVSGNMRGVRCIGHVQQFLRPPVSAFYRVTLLVGTQN